MEENTMTDITLTREEAKELKKYLYGMLYDMCEYHHDIEPYQRDNLSTLVEKYCYWANKYNDGYMWQMDEKDDRLAEFMVQEYNRLFNY
jgi:hypothetical protein